jgi:hypothetical protein
MLATRKDVPFQVITATLVAIAFASGIATGVPEEIQQSSAASTPTPYSADHARITNFEPLPPTF